MMRNVPQRGDASLIAGWGGAPIRDPREDCVRGLRATALALVPLAVAGSIPGHEVEHPMAIVILGGLLSSTLLNLFVLPSLCLRFDRGAMA
jgi:AcrB/AcrD/AcrF family